MKRIVMALLLAAAPWTCGAHGPCDPPVETLRVPASWIRSTSNGIVTWRSASSREALTAATYQVLGAPSAGQRAELARKAVLTERRLERQLAGPELRLSDVTRSGRGSVLQLCHYGSDAAQGRAFISVTRVSAGFLQHFYYEGEGLSGAELARNAAWILGSGRPGEAAVSAVPAPAIATLPALALPPALGP